PIFTHVVVFSQNKLTTSGGGPYKAYPLFYFIRSVVKNNIQSIDSSQLISSAAENTIIFRVQKISFRLILIPNLFCRYPSDSPVNRPPGSVLVNTKGCPARS